MLIMVTAVHFSICAVLCNLVALMCQCIACNAATLHCSGLACEAGQAWLARQQLAASAHVAALRSIVQPRRAGSDCSSMVIYCERSGRLCGRTLRAHCAQMLAGHVQQLLPGHVTNQEHLCRRRWRCRTFGLQLRQWQIRTGVFVMARTRANLFACNAISCESTQTS